MNGHDLAFLIIGVCTALPGIIAALRANTAANRAAVSVTKVSDVQETLNGSGRLPDVVKEATTAVLEEHGIIPPGTGG